MDNTKELSDFSLQMANSINRFELLPSELINLLLESLCKTSVLGETSKVSLIVFSHVNKFCYNTSSRYAVTHKFTKRLECHQIAAEGSLGVLQWARQNGCVWDFRTCDYATRNGHIEVLKWAHENGCICIWGYYT